MMRGWPMAGVLALVLAASLAGAAPPPDRALGAFTASTVSMLVDGSLTGQMLALSQVPPQRATGLSGVADIGQFEIQAAKAHVELDVNRGPMSVSGAGLPMEPDQFAADHFQATARGTEARIDHELYLLSWPGHPLPQVRVTHALGALSASSEETVQPYEWPNSVREAVPEVGVSNADQWTQVGTAASLEVSGDFILSLWDWDIAVSSGGQAAQYFSGQRNGPAEEPTGLTPLLGGAVYSYNMTQLWVYVSDGVFRSPWFSPADTVLFVSGETIEAGSLELLDVSGEFSTSTRIQFLQARMARVEGDLKLEASPSFSRGVDAVLLGSARSASFDGQPLALASVAAKAGGSGLPAWLPWLGLGVLAPTAGGAELLRRHRQTVRMQRLAVEMDAGDYESVAAHADALVPTRAYGQDASVMKALSLIQLGRLEDARDFLVHQRIWDGPQAATQHYLRAYVLALGGEREPAIEELDACLRTSPDYQTEVLANPTFLTLLDDPRLQGLLASQTGQPRTGPKAPPEGYA